MMTTESDLAPAILQAPTSRARLVETVAPLVFRTDLEAPGFVVLDLGVDCTPLSFRARLVELGRALGDYYLANFRTPLPFVSVSRFDQQASTRPHRDGGPDASILLLGYEPTAVPSRLNVLDFTRAAVDRDQTPADFLDDCNPAFGGDARLLDSYNQEVGELDWGHYQILIVNNSCLPYAQRHRGMLGVLHQAHVARPDPARPRAIASLLLGVAPAGLDDQQLEAFVAEAAPAAVSVESGWASAGAAQRDLTR